jgi:hypothetical protein
MAKYCSFLCTQSFPLEYDKNFFKKVTKGHDLAFQVITSNIMSYEFVSASDPPVLSVL